MRVVTIKDLSAKICSAFKDKAESVGKKWNRFTQLNQLLKGFRTGELTVLSGKTGTGKTTFACEYSLDLAEQNIKTLWGSFEISNVKLCKTLLTQFSRIALKEAENHDKIEPFIEKFFHEVPMYFIESRGYSNCEELMQELTQSQEKYQIQHIILDNLQYINGTMSTSMSDSFQTQDRLVGQIRQFIHGTNCHVTLIAHPRKENSSEELTINSLYGGCKLSQEADNVMLLQTVGKEDKARKYIEVVKHRYDGCLGNMDLNFDKETLCFSGNMAKSCEESKPARKDRSKERDDIKRESKVKRNVDKEKLVRRA